jgi:hypothetical protein
MKLNVGPLESFFRIFIGVCLLYATLHQYVGQIGYVGGLLIASGLSRFSLIKAVLGLNGNTGETSAGH